MMYGFKVMACNICGVHDYGCYHVNVHPHLKLHEQCMCMVDEADLYAQKRKRPPVDAAGSPVASAGGPVANMEKNAELLVLEPEDLLQLLRIRKDDEQDEKKQVNIAKDIDSLEKVVKHPNHDPRDPESIYFSLGSGLTVKKPTVSCGEMCLMLGSRRVKKTAPLGIHVTKDRGPVAVNALIPILYGSRAMKFWCDQYGVKCRDLDVEGKESDYDICVLGHNAKDLTFEPFSDSHKTIDGITTASWQPPQQEKKATSARTSTTQRKKRKIKL